MIGSALQQRTFSSPILPPPPPPPQAPPAPPPTQLMPRTVPGPREKRISPGQDAAAAAAGDAATRTAAAPPLPVPPELTDIDCPDDDAEGIYVDETDFQTAQANVKRWLELSEEIRKLTAAAAERRKQKNALDQYIINFMKNHKIPHFDLSNGKLSLAQTKSTQPLNKKWIHEQLTQFSEIDEDQKLAIETRLCDNRPVAKKDRLKHSAPRAKKTSKK